MDTGLKLWTDAYNQYRQIIMGPEKRVLYERYKKDETFDTSHGQIITLSGWGLWSKVVEEYGYIEKAWHIRDLTIEDLILDNEEKQQ